MKLRSLLLIPVICFAAACAKKAATTPTDNASNGGGGGGSTFTSAQIAKSWTSDCIASTDSRLGTSYYRNKLTLNANGSYMFQQYLHTGTGGSNCNNANYVVIFTLYGAYSVGSVVSGSMQAIVFGVVTSGGTAPDLMVTNSWNSTPSVTQVQDAFNTDCGGTSPYCTLVNSACTNNGSYGSGAHAASQHMLCQNYTFPNSSNNTIYNVATYSGGVLTLGAGLTGMPGVLNSGSMPGSVSVAYH